MLIQEHLTLREKLEILTDAAKYDVACTSSGADRKGKKGTMGSAVPAGICHSFSADGRCISLLKILLPMRQIQRGIEAGKQELIPYRRDSAFVPAGQSTQMIVGATPESDYQMLSVAEALYQSYGLKRVFYSAFVRVNDDSLLPALPGGPPLLREHRLYQADWLLRYYGFQAGELLSEDHPNFNVLLDPKCDWAVRHLEQFPVEVNRADYYTLLRVPGMGVKSARRIVEARRHAALDFPDLKRFGVVLKRAMYFITCSGRVMMPFRQDQDAIAASLAGEERRRAWEIGEGNAYRQMSLFDDFHITVPPTAEDVSGAVWGVM